jgi:2-methylcitrate dehydratase PrpD
LTAGKLLGFGSEEMGRALGLAYAQAAGNSQSIYDGSASTCLQQGFSAKAGILSALLAEAGLSGARRFLTGRAGLYPVYYRGMDYNIDRLTRGIGDRYEFLNIATKPYPSCGFTMAPIENAIGLIKTHQLSPDDIEQMIISVNKKMHATVCAPAERKFRPQEPADALFSMPYVIATGVLKGEVVLDDFTQGAIDEPRRLQLMGRIRIVEDQSIEKEAIETNMALGTHSIRIDCKDGRRIERKLNYSCGFPQNPMTLDQCAMKAKKIISSLGRPIPETRIDEIKKAIETLDMDNTLKSLICLMS